MSTTYNCGCDHDCDCNCEQPINCIEQAVNDALAGRIDELDGYADRAETGAENAEASATYAANSATQAGSYRDQSQVILNSAQALVPEINETSANLQETAEIVQQLILNASSYQIVKYPYTVLGGESSITVPETYAALTVQSIIVEGVTLQSQTGDFTFDSTSRVITLAQAFDTEAAGTTITVQLGQSNAESPETVLTALASPSGAGLINTVLGSSVQAAIYGQVNAAAFGYKADYNPDTQVGTDNTIFLRNAIQFCMQNNYRKLILPPGAGLITDYIPIDNEVIGEAIPDIWKGCQDGVHLQGAGMYSTILVFDAPDTETPAIKITGSYGTHTARAISDLAIVPRITAAYNVDTIGQGIQYIGGCFVPVHNVIIGRFHKGICYWNKNKGANDTDNAFNQGDFTEFNRINNVRIFNCDIGIDHIVSLGNPSFHGNSSHDLQIQIRPYGGIGIRGIDDGSKDALKTPVGNYDHLANVYNNHYEVNFFGSNSSTCYAIWLERAQGRGWSGDMTAEGAITLKTVSFEWMYSFGSIHSISAINTEVGTTDTNLRPVAFMWHNAAYPQAFFDGVDPILLDTSYPRQFDLNNSGNTGMDLLNVRGAQTGNIWSQIQSTVSAGWLLATRSASGSRPSQRTIWQFSYDGTKIKAPSAASIGLYNATVGIDLTATALVPSVAGLNIGAASLRWGTGYFDGWNIGSSGLVPVTDVNVNVGSPTLRINRVYTPRVYYTATVFDSVGSGSPEGVLAAGIGSTYRRTDGGASTSFYVKESGVGNIGWIAK